MIKYAQGNCGVEELQEVSEALDYGYFGMAYKVVEFETAIQKYLQSTFEIACVNTGTSALHLALDGIGVGVDDEVILPSFTFVATAQVVTACGATPVFADINEHLVISPDDIEKKISTKTKAIIVVHYNGQPADMDKIHELAKKHNIRVIEDAAHAFGSYYKNKRIGSFGDIICFSFDSIKVITCGEGGAILTGDKDLIEKIRYKRLLGMKRVSMTDINWKNRAANYDVVTNGFRYHMSNINAGIGLAQLKKIDSFLDYRLSLVSIYKKGLEKSNLISFYDFNFDSNANFMMPVKVHFGLRDQLKKFLLSKEIETNISYIPIHTFSFYKNHAKGDYKTTDSVFEEILCLPMHTKLTEQEVQFVISSILDFENENRR